MEEKLFKALALLLLEPRIDQWGNQIQSPLKEAIEKWAYDKREDIASEVVKNIGKEELAIKVANKVVEELVRRNWDKNYQEEELNKLVLEKVAKSLADKQLEKLNNQLN